MKLWPALILLVGCAPLTEAERDEREYNTQERLLQAQKDMELCERYGGQAVIKRNERRRPAHGGLGRWDSWRCMR